MSATDLRTKLGDPAFVLDTARHILTSNTAAARLLGVANDQIQGRLCHTVLNCCDLERRPLCPGNCPLLPAPHQEKPSTAVELLVRHHGGHTLEVSASALQVPAEAGQHLVILLRPSACGLIEAHPFTAGALESQSPTVGEPDARPLVDLHRTLDRLLLASGAEAAELFLTVPATGHAVLAAHRAAAPCVFRQIVCFEKGQGFPAS